MTDERWTSLQAPLTPRRGWERLGFWLLDVAVWALRRAGYFRVEKP